MKYSRLLFSALAGCLFATSALAQMQDPYAERIDRLQRDVMMLQRQMARSGVPVNLPPSSGGAAATASADIEVRLSAIEDAMRDLRGKVEENDFQVRRLAETLEKFQKDTEFRFNELNPSHATDTQQAPPADIPADETAEGPPPETPTEPQAAAPEAPEGPTTAGDGVLRAPSQTGEMSDYASPRDLYNYAFRLLNQTRYEDAAGAFSTFIKRYPKDPLIGNAYYWQGETFYIRHDYVNAADSFRQGFEALPGGPKAPDNLLKLAMSLDALNRDKEACIVLDQITTKYRKSSVSVAAKASQEQRRIGCR